MIYFILVRPSVAENVGFVCRSLKNMGFANLRVVGSSVHKLKGARNTAYQAHDILDRAQEYEDLQTALADIDLAIGTTAKSRKGRFDYLRPEGLTGFLTIKASTISKVAVVFGSESDGLSQEEENQCDVLSTIPMAIGYPSINLSHSLMIYAYELSKHVFPKENSTEEWSAPSNEREFKELKEQSVALLEQLGVSEKQPGIFQRAKDRLALLSASDTRLVLTLMRYFKHHLKM